MTKIARPVIKALFGLALLVVQQQVHAEFLSNGSYFNTNVDMPSYPTSSDCQELSSRISEILAVIRDDHSACLKQSGPTYKHKGNCSHAQCEDVHNLRDQKASEFSEMKRSCTRAAAENARNARSSHFAVYLTTYSSITSTLNNTISSTRYKSATPFLKNAIKASNVKRDCDVNNKNLDPNKCLAALGSYVSQLNQFSQSSSIVQSIQDNSLGAIISHQKDMFRKFDTLQEALKR